MTTGIYTIKNMNSGKAYVGSAVNVMERFRQHKESLRRNRHHNVHLQRAWNKHGENAFEFQMLLICAPAYLIDFEQRCIDGFKSGYNICPTAGSSLGMKLSKEACRKMSEALKGRSFSEETRLKMSAARKGWLFSEETRRKMSEAAKTRTHTAETLMKMSAAQKGHCVSEETRRKISDAQRGRKGRNHTIESRMKISAAIKKWWGEPRRRSDTDVS